jgi:hypothetical protein
MLTRRHRLVVRFGDVSAHTEVGVCAENVIRIDLVIIV